MVRGGGQAGRGRLGPDGSASSSRCEPPEKNRGERLHTAARGGGLFMFETGLSVHTESLESQQLFKNCFDN